MSKKHRILVVDDEESITYLVKTELEELSEFDVDTTLPKGGTNRALAPGRTRGHGRTRENLPKRRRY
jgi:CheY-like chemotaxis protein